MIKPCQPFKFVALVLATFSIFGCDKENGIDNNNVIKKPYSVYVSDSLGGIYNTSNGDDYKILPYVDGIPLRALVTSGPNLLMIKRNVFLNKGLDFDSTQYTTDSASWQPMILDVRSHDRLYLAINAPYGVTISEDNGVTWRTDDKWSTSIANPTDIRITSFTQLKSGLLFAFDHINRRLYKRDNRDADWQEVTMSGLPATGTFYLSHINNVLTLTDFKGTEGVWHSENDGQTWAQYGGLPAQPLYTTYAPADEVLLVGTEVGAYRLLGNTFVTANNGLLTGAKVRGIAGKNDIYKNDVNKQYVYMATSKGVYRSEDQGQNWKLVKTGNYTTIY